jgi:hypothetical protein
VAQIFAQQLLRYAGSAATKCRVEKLSEPEPYRQNPPAPPNLSPLRRAVRAARADQSLTRDEKEEIDLVEANIKMRAGVWLS